MTQYPYYTVEGRRFAAEEYRLAQHFARLLANRYGRPVHLLRALDRWTPDAVIFTAEPEAEAGGQR